MKLFTITITGADDETDIEVLEKLSDEYPYVEWGILLSSSRQGTRRYPSFQWRQEFFAAKDKLGYPLRSSLHICGSKLREIIMGMPQEGPFFPPPVYGQRVQLNIGNPDPTIRTLNEILFNVLSKVESLIWGKDYPDREVKDHFLIVQCTKATRDYLNADLQRYCLDISYLFDSSGGRGIKPKEWPKHPGVGSPIGYCGGLNPDNLADSLEQIQIAAGNNVDEWKPIWVDIESGVRTEDRFDLDKVVRCLEITREYLKSR